MIKYSIALAIILQGCAVDSAYDEPGQATPRETPATSPGKKEETQTGALASPEADRRRKCIETLSSSKRTEEGDALSAFKQWNEYPPSASTIAPGDANLESSSPEISGLSSCLDSNPFTFEVLVDGILINGDLEHLTPLASWKLPNGYMAFYMHKNYEVSDGEGESVEISSVIFDMDGKALRGIQEVSSWYEYEGSIRIRDLAYIDGNFVTSEEVFDPQEQDDTGNVLEYNNERGISVIRRYDPGDL
jgi:hypothetical protein